MKLVSNKPQTRLMLTKPNSAISIWGRGTGKTFIICWIIYLCVKWLPRGKGMLVSPSFRQLLENSLPSIIYGLELLGLFQEKHYFIGRKPPKSWEWPTPYSPPGSYVNSMYFYSGFVLQFVSMDKNATSARGKSVDIIIADEALHLDKERFDDDVSAANRGNLEIFKKVPFHHGVFYFSSMPVGEQGKWMLDHSQYYYDDGINFRSLMNELIELQLQVVLASNIKERMEAWNESKQLYQQIKFYKSSQNFLYSEANVFDNILNIGIDYIIQEHDRIITIQQFLRELLNKHIKKIEGGFYAAFSRKLHTYTGANDYGHVGDLDKFKFNSKKSSDCRFDGDLIPTLPLHAGMDWGTMNSMVIGQQMHHRNELRILKNLFVQKPKILDDLADDFCTYYQYHKTKKLYLYYDNSGNNEQVNSKFTVAQEFKKRVESQGWIVVLKTKGKANPIVSKKFLLINRCFMQQEKRYPSILINGMNCAELIHVLETTPQKDVNGTVGKDKSSERNKSLPQHKATHLGDAFDALVYGLFGGVLRRRTNKIDLI